MFARLQAEQIIVIPLEAVGLDSTSIKIHPDGTGARKKTGHKPSAARAGAKPPKFIWSPRLRAVR